MSDLDWEHFERVDVRGSDIVYRPLSDFILFMYLPSLT